MGPLAYEMAGGDGEQHKLEVRHRADGCWRAPSWQKLVLFVAEERNEVLQTIGDLQKPHFDSACRLRKSHTQIKLAKQYAKDGDTIAQTVVCFRNCVCNASLFRKLEYKGQECPFANSFSSFRFSAANFPLQQRKQFRSSKNGAVRCHHPERCSVPDPRTAWLRALSYAHLQG